MNSMNQPENDITGLAKIGDHRRIWQIWALLLACLIVTALASYYTKSGVDGDAKREFDFNCKEIQIKIQDRLSAHEQILRSGAAFFEHSGGVSREDWCRFADRQKVDQQLLGIQGIGFALVIPRQKLAQHVLEIRAEGFPQYQVRPDGEREIYTSIIYLEPFTNRNLRAFGYDMFSEPVRRAAMERARDQDAAALSGKVILVQENDNNVQAGTLMYVPVYRQGVAHDTAAQKRDALIGWVYSPHRMNDLMEGTLGGWNLIGEKRIHLEVFDGETISSDTLLYDSQPNAGNMASRPVGQTSGLPGVGASGSVAHSLSCQTTLEPSWRIDATSRLTLQNKVVLAGTQWTLRLTRAGSQLSSTNYGKVWFVLFGGTSSSLLLCGLFFSMLNTRFKALQMAKKLTTELAKSERSYHNQFAHNSAVMLLINPTDGAIVDVNAAAVSFYGYLRERMLAMRITDINRKPIAELLQNLTSIHPEQGQRFQSQHHLANGELRDVEVSMSYIQFGGRTVLHSIVFDITERKRAEEALRASEAFNLSILNSVSAQIAVLDRDGIILAVNEPWRRFALENSAEPGNPAPHTEVGANYLTACRAGIGFTSEEAMNVLVGIQAVLDGRMPSFCLEYPCHSPQQQLWFSMTTTPLNLDGLGVVISHVDITARKLADEAKHESEIRLRTITDSAHDAILMMDPKGRVSYWNPAAERIFGYTQTEAFGMKMHSLIAPSRYHAEHNAAFPEFLRTGHGGAVGKTLDMEALRKDGKEISVQISLAAIELSGTWHAVAVIRDITEHKLAEIEHAAIIETALDGFYMADLEGRFLEVNNAYCQMSGYSRAELLQMRIADIEVAETSTETAGHIAKIMSQGQDHFETRHRRKDGSVFHVAANVQSSSARGGILIAFMQDITERKQVELALQTAKEAAEAATRAKSELLANMSHEIRTPMNAIIGMGYLIQDTPLNSKQQGYVKNINHAAGSLLGIINDILDFSKIEAGKLEIATTDFALEDVLSKVLSLIGGQVGVKQLQLHSLISQDVPTHLHGDPLRLMQILNNLMSNAVKFTASGDVFLSVKVMDNASPVTCGAGLRPASLRGFKPLDQNQPTESETPGTGRSETCPTMPERPTIQLEFSVKDTGIGLSAQDQAKLFQPFTQADATITRHYGGTGLGLAICRRLTDLMGGAIHLESAPGQGSNFIVRLPFGRVSEQAQTGISESVTSALPLGGVASLRFDRASVLLVEDNVMNQQVAMELLAKV